MPFPYEGFLWREFQFVLERDFRYSIFLFAICALANTMIKADRGRHYRQVVFAKSTL